MEHLSIDNPWYVTGFAEGEGAFTYSRSGRSITPVFSIRQRHDRADLIERIQDFFGVGTIYPCKASGRSEASSYFKVFRWDELPVIVAHFDEYPLQSKRKHAAFEAWKDLVKTRGLRGVGSGTPQELLATARRLSALNTRSRGFSTRERVESYD